MNERQVPAGCVLIGSLVMVLAVASVAPAQVAAPPAAPPVAPPAAPSASAPSNQAEVVELQNKVKQFEEVAAELSGARRALAQPHPVFTEFADATTRYRANPDDQGAAAKYAEKFAQALQEMDGRHDRLLALQDKVNANFRAFEAIATARASTLQQQRDQSLKTADEHQETAEHWQGKLKELAVQYADLIKAGQSLPEEVDQLAERADILLAHATTKETLYRGFAARSEASIRRAKQSLKSAQQWHRRAELHFLNAEGHGEIITLMASIQRDELESPLPNFSEQEIELEPLDDPPILSDLLKALNRDEVVLPEDHVTEAEDPADLQKGREILSRILNTQAANVKRPRPVLGL